MGAGVGDPGGHQFPFGDDVVDLGVQVWEGLVDHAEVLLGLLGALAAEIPGHGRCGLADARCRSTVH